MYKSKFFQTVIFATAALILSNSAKGTTLSPPSLDDILKSSKVTLPQTDTVKRNGLSQTAWTWTFVYKNRPWEIRMLEKTPHTGSLTVSKALVVAFAHDATFNKHLGLRPISSHPDEVEVAVVYTADWGGDSLICAATTPGLVSERWVVEGDKFVSKATSDPTS